MERLIEKQMANIEKAYESIPMGGKLEFSKSAIEGIYQVLKELKEYKDLEEQGLLLRLPCKVGTDVYIISTCESVPTKLDGGYWDATGYYCPYEDCDDCPFVDLEDCDSAKGKLGIFKDEFVGISIDSYCGKWNILTEFVCDNFTIEDFGKTVFLTHEQAEQKLKELQEGEKKDGIKI